MFKNYFLVVWRSLCRHPVFALINITGLTLGLGFAILVLQYVSYQGSYDRQYANAEKSYRIVNGERWVRGRENYNVYMPTTLVELKEEVPEIRYVATYKAPENYEVEIEGQQFEDALSFVNSDFFRIFDVPFLQGDPATAVDIPFSVVLTESLAKKYFNSTDVVGRNLLLEGETNLTVSGVIADFDRNTHIANGMFASHNSASWRGFANNAGAAPYRYLLSVYLQFAGGNAQQLLKRINELYQQEMQQLAQSEMGRRFFRGNNEPQDLTLQALTDIHFSQAQHEVRQVEGSEASVTKITYGMTAALAIGLVVMILVISCCNYIYLSIARASQRSKEIAMRKVTGASRRQLFGQFICESLLITLIATLFALLLAWVLRPLVAGFAGVDEAAFGFGNLQFLLMLFSLVLITAVLAGLYPALVLSGVSPLQALVGSGGALGKVKLRRLLVVCQFAVAAMLLMVTFFIFKQLAWLEDADMGFESENVVVVSPQSRIRGRGNFASSAITLRDELLQNRDIKAVSVSDRGPLRFSGSASLEVKVYGQSDDQFVEFNSLGVDDYFDELYKPRLQAGRFLDAKTYPADLTQRERWTVTSGGAAVLTETAMKMLSIADPEQIVGKKLDVKITGFRGWGASEDLKEYTVVGVIDDLNFGTGSSAINPHVLITSFAFPGYFAVKTSGENSPQVIQAITGAFGNAFPGMSFRANFLSELYQRENAALMKLGSGFSVVTLISVVISCLGLYAIAAFTVQRRTKEVGVRKAIGASAGSIIRLLMWDFTKPVLISIALALPAAVLAIYKMLQYLPNHPPVGLLIYLEVILAVLAIAWLTVSSHTLRTAVDSPTNALRYE